MKYSIPFIVGCVFLFSFISKILNLFLESKIKKCKEDEDDKIEKIGSTLYNVRIITDDSRFLGIAFWGISAIEALLGMPFNDHIDSTVCLFLLIIILAVYQFIYTFPFWLVSKIQSICRKLKTRKTNE